MNQGVLKYGSLVDGSTTAAAENFPGASIMDISFCTTPIELLSNDDEESVVGTATGFFWKRGGEIYLITNYHVISGRNPLTGMLNSNGYIPRKFKFYGHALSGDENETKHHRPYCTLRFGDAFEEAVSKPLEVNGLPVDIWAIPVSEGGVFGKDPSRKVHPELSCFVNELNGHPINTSAGDDCFILGYPLHNYGGLALPVWKRGSIASDTQVGVEGRPIFLIDAATTSGMSGSPIFRRVVGKVDLDPETGAFRETVAFFFIGIYAGRLESAELQATNLGYGWYRTIIDTAIDAFQYSVSTRGSPLP